MDKNKMIIGSIFAAFVGFISFSNFNEVEAANIYGCNPDAERKAEVNTTAKFKDYLELINVDYTKYISKAKKDLNVNKNYAVNNCLIVYGGPNDVVDERRKSQTWSNGEPLYLGYNEQGKLYPNPSYPDYAPEADYFNTKPFIKNPWSNSGLNTDINNSATKPFTINPKDVKPTYNDPDLGRVRTPQQELDRAVDRMYLENCGKSCGLGDRGYFPKVNTALGHNLKGSNLYNYASVQDYPDGYSAGVFTMYYRSTVTGNYWYASSFLPPYKLFLQEKRDLSLEITSISPKEVWEKDTYKVSYKICNNGDIDVKNPNIIFGDQDTQKHSQTVKTTVKANKCYSGSVEDEAYSVDEDHNKRYYMTVNPDDNNPKDEDNRKNNSDHIDFTIKAILTDLSTEIVSVKPATPNTNEAMEVKLKFCNLGNHYETNVTFLYGFEGGAEKKYDIDKMESGDCVTVTDKTKGPEIDDYHSRVYYITDTHNSWYKYDIEPNNNRDSKTVLVQNPDISTEILVDNEGSDNTIGSARVKIENFLFGNTTELCADSESGCKTGTNKKEFVINIYDTKFTDSTSDDVLVKTLKPSYDLTFGQTDYANINKSIFTDWVKEKYPSTYQLVQFRITAQLPEYKKEVDWQGNSSYENNFDSDILNYFPPRPDLGTGVQCNEYEHSITNYFNTGSGGFGPIKMCAGHYPTYPSTTVESGMQAYHYVLYRFLPTPLPKYTVTTPEVNEKSPNHFAQIFKLPTSENINKAGDVESMYLTKNNGKVYQERGRYMPTGGVFDFEIYKNTSSGSKGDVIALGTVSYNIPKTCYEKFALDISHQYGCDEILFFLPNADTNSKYEKPNAYTNQTVSYPIRNTKIPYLNPGKYTFEFEAKENFRYYYQTNSFASKNSYHWNQAKFK